MQNKFIFKKSLGQNFLRSSAVANRIACASGDLRNKLVLEIGPGHGILTRQILNMSPELLISVDIDSRCIEALEGFDQSNFLLINDDAMQIDESYLFDSAKVLRVDNNLLGSVNNKITIISNLPYNIGTLLLLKWIKKIHLFENIVLMLQKEVIDRIIAKPATKEYGRLSVIVQSMATVKKLFDVSKELFKPVPKVDSSVILITPKFELLEEKVFETLECIIKLAFSQRRKMLRSTMKNYSTTLEKLQINQEKRGENLSIDEFIQIAKNII